jgi:hypothetical protein
VGRISESSIHPASGKGLSAKSAERSWPTGSLGGLGFHASFGLPVRAAGPRAPLALGLHSPCPWRRNAPPPCHPGAVRRRRAGLRLGRGGSLRAAWVVYVLSPRLSQRYLKAPGSHPYSAECVEEAFCELRVDGVLRSLIRRREGPGYPSFCVPALELRRRDEQRKDRAEARAPDRAHRRQARVDPQPRQEEAAAGEEVGAEVQVARLLLGRPGHRHPLARTRIVRPGSCGAPAFKLPWAALHSHSPWGAAFALLPIPENAPRSVHLADASGWAKP